MNTETLQRIRKEVYGVSEINSAFRNKIRELFYQQTKSTSLKTKADTFDMQFSDRWF